MIKINCETKDKLKLVELIPFQGGLKKRTEQDLKELKESLTTEGLMMPFAVWKRDDKYLLLDGHGRKQVLMQMVDEDPSLLSVDWPVIFIDADTEDDARKALLQITSSYGKITRSGVKQFCVSIPDYKAPAISKFVANKTTVTNKSISAAQKSTPDKVVLKVRIEKDKVAQVKEILSQFSFIEVL